jgi:large subunit ribosomal protein L4
MITMPVYNMQGKEVEKINLNSNVFDGKVNTAAIYQAVVMYQANKRKGAASTKTRGEVRGGGRKPWRQKGTGRARAGTIRSPLWRGGGIIFGPHPRDYSYSIPKKIQRLALKSSLNSKLSDNDLLVIDEIKVDKPKTKEFTSLLASFKIADKSLVVLESLDSNIDRSSRNISIVTMKNFKDVNTYDVLKHKKLILTKKSLAGLVERILKHK